MSSRLIPFTVAGIICFGISFFLGAAVWYFFGTNHGRFRENNRTTVQVSNPNSEKTNNEASNAAEAQPAQPAPAAIAEIRKAPAGEVFVEGGEVVLGGGETKLPLRRVAVSPFYIGETEVTNQQYANFVEATGRSAPAVWKAGKFPPGTGDEPVVGVTWKDAADYCEWLGKEINAEVRLPSEAEWMRAARGNADNKYPWGNEWNDEAASSAETQGKVLKVKSFPAGRSPSGAFEMIGNVWEWTSELAVDEFGKPILYGKSQQRIIKGGSAKEDRQYLTVEARAPRPEDRPSDLLGFRYVIVRR